MRNEVEDHRTMGVSVLVSKNQLFHLPENQRTKWSAQFHIPRISERHVIKECYRKLSTNWQRHRRVAADMCIITVLPSQSKRPVVAQRLLSARYISATVLEMLTSGLNTKFTSLKKLEVLRIWNSADRLSMVFLGDRKKKLNSSTLVTPTYVCGLPSRFTFKHRTSQECLLSSTLCKRAPVGAVH
jgi:hypothetical protein